MKNHKIKNGVIEFGNGLVACLYVPEDGDVDVWLNDIIASSKDAGLDPDNENYTLISCTCPCGATLNIRTAADFPRENRQCAEGHYFVYYEKEPGK